MVDVRSEDFSHLAFLTEPFLMGFEMKSRALLNFVFLLFLSLQTLQRMVMAVNPPLLSPAALETPYKGHKLSVETLSAPECENPIKGPQAECMNSEGPWLAKRT